MLSKVLFLVVSVQVATSAPPPAPCTTDAVDHDDIIAAEFNHNNCSSLVAANTTNTTLTNTTLCEELLIGYACPVSCMGALNQCYVAADYKVDQDAMMAAQSDGGDCSTVDWTVCDQNLFVELLCPISCAGASPPPATVVQYPFSCVASSCTTLFEDSASGVSNVAAACSAAVAAVAEAYSITDTSGIVCDYACQDKPPAACTSRNRREVTDNADFQFFVVIPAFTGSADAPSEELEIKLDTGGDSATPLMSAQPSTKEFVVGSEDDGTALGRRFPDATSKKGKGKKEPKASKAPKEPKASKAPKEPKASKAPKEPRVIKVLHKAPNEPKASKAPKNPKAKKTKAPKGGHQATANGGDLTISFERQQVGPLETGKTTTTSRVPIAGLFLGCIIVLVGAVVANSKMASKEKKRYNLDVEEAEELLGSTQGKINYGIDLDITIDSYLE